MLLIQFLQLAIRKHATNLRFEVEPLVPPPKVIHHQEAAVQQIASQRDHFFEFLVGFGTDTFENGPDVENVRILFGGTREF